MISKLSALKNISRNSISSLFRNVSYIFKENSHQCIVHFQRAGCIVSQFICHMQKQAISYFCQVRSGKELKALLLFFSTLCCRERERERERESFELWAHLYTAQHSTLLPRSQKKNGCRTIFSDFADIPRTLFSSERHWAATGRTSGGDWTAPARSLVGLRAVVRLTSSH